MRTNTYQKSMYLINIQNYLMSFILGFLACFVVLNIGYSISNNIGKISHTRNSIAYTEKYSLETTNTVSNYSTRVEIPKEVEYMEKAETTTALIEETTTIPVTETTTIPIQETNTAIIDYPVVKPSETTTQKKVIEEPAVTTAPETVQEDIPVNDDPVEETTTPEITNLGYHCSAKTYSSWKAVTATGSEQYNLLHNTQVHVCDDGMLRDDDGYICAALGTYFGKIGSRWVFVLEDGREIKIIKCDAKADSETDAAHICGVANYDIIEFYIETSKFTKEANGYVNWGNFNNVAEYKGAVVGWYQVDDWYDSAY